MAEWHVFVDGWFTVEADTQADAEVEARNVLSMGVVDLDTRVESA